VSVEKDLNAFNKKIQKALDELVSPKELNKIGNFEAGLIKRRSRLGYGVPKDLSAKEKFKELRPKTVAARKRKKLASETTPNKSNLTETGQLLNDLVSKIEGRSTLIGHTKDRNKRIGAFHQTGGGSLPQRRYLGLALEDLKQIKAQMQDAFNDILNKIFK